MAEAADFQGTLPSAARRWLRRTGALVAAVPLLAGVVQLPAGPAAAQTAAQAPVRSPQADATGSRTVDVSLDSLSPAAPVDGDTLTVSGTLTNEGKQAITDAQVDLRVGPRLDTRSAIDAAAQRSGYQQGADGLTVGGKYVQKFAKIAPGLTQSFSISVPMKDLNLTSDGIYQLGVSLTGDTAAQPYPSVLGIERTFLPWQTETSDARTKTTFLWPLISTTHLTAETGSDEQQTRVFEDDELAKEIGPGGRLQQMLSLGSSLDVTWVVDPDLLASVDAMTRNYWIKSKDTLVAGRNQAVANQWLNELEKAVQGKKVVALPFADPDLASLAHNGKNVSGSLSHLKAATDVATDTVETVLHVTPTTEFAWPVNGAIDPSVVDVATSAGADTVIARSDSMRESSALPYTPSAARPIGGGTRAVVADARLSTAFQGDMTRAEDSTLAVQEFLAQSLMITLQDPGEQRSVVVAPQRMPTASQAQAMAQAIRTLSDGRWTQAQDLTAAARTKPDSQATTQVPSARSYPASLRKQELTVAAFEKVKETQAKLDSFKVILTLPDRVVTPFGRAIDRSMSTSWRGHAAEGYAFRTSVTTHLTSLTQSVQLIDKSDAQLSGRSAVIPVTVKNGLLQGVDHLTLRLTSKKPSRFKIGDGVYQELPVKVSGGHSQSFKFETTANVNGLADVVAQLYTEDGTPYGREMPFQVQVNEVTPTVMLVIAGGMLLLVLAGFRMYQQRKRAAARQAEQDAEDEAADGSEDAADPAAGAPGAPGRPGDDISTSDRHQGESGTGSGEHDPEQPSDPTPDTVAESADPSGTGERVDR
ncbi:DUF6049 family protein [Streptomyces sp. NPDC091292]|uniref:DUF6049 family protein n=1 Tax=Streptomyces sp. NPDC091292 TaxID=3365991 RepID=UPI0037FB4D99